LNIPNFNVSLEIPEPPKKKRKIGRWILLAILLFWFFNSMIDSEMFDGEDPVIEIEDVEFWNLKEPINLKISDNVAIKSYKISIDNGVGEIELFEEGYFEEPTVKELEFNITAPTGRKNKSSYTTILIEVEDSSVLNFFGGNRVELKKVITVDKESPKISIINNSYGIRRAGSALVVFSVEEQNLEDVFIETPSGKKFYPQPFHQSGGKKRNFISLLAWAIGDDRFNGTIHAKDKAGNSSTQFVNLYLKEKKYKVSNIELKESFLTGKIRNLASQHEQATFVDNPIEHFKIVNEDIRRENDEIIYEITSQINKDKTVKEFNILPFSPLKGSRSVASFGDLRKYHFDGEIISEARHMGLDMASIRMAPIVTSNDGRVVDTRTKGIYGLSPIIDHGLGLYSIYAHCSSARVSDGNIVQAGEIIGNTGKSGLALGDHLHFGIYVQGVPVRPEEWMDKKWIKENITDVIASSKQMIERERR
jgi:murein DD-endopeptidase MepM/ murein hydrolase activator NlpD